MTVLCTGCRVAIILPPGEALPWICDGCGAGPDRDEMDHEWRRNRASDAARRGRKEKP